MPRGVYKHKKGIGGRKGRSGVYQRTSEMKTGKHMLGRKRSEETKEKIRKANRISIKKKWQDPEYRKKVIEHSKRSEEYKDNLSKSRRGKNNPNWKGGKSRLHHVGKKYREWRTAVFERDNWTCQTCWERGGKLQAHHIKSWVKYPKLRYDVNNGVTLCLGCHKLANKLQREKERRS